MRTQVIGLLFLGLTSLMNAQSNSDAKNVGEEVSNVELSGLVISANSKYMNKAYDENSSIEVRELVQRVADFDLKETNIFDPKFDSYNVNFSTRQSEIEAIYDSKGVVQSTNERYNNILVPNSIRHAVYRDYPGWTLHKNTYSVTYSQNGNIKKLYKIQVRKDGERKNLKIDVVNNKAIVSAY